MDASWQQSLADAVRRKIPSVLFAALAGDHLRGIAGEHSPCIVTGAMVLPLRDVLGLRPARETKERQISVDGRDVTLVFHDIRHYLDQVARTANTRNLEELFSPQVVIDGAEQDHLKRIAGNFINRLCFHDFRDRASARRRRLESLQPAGVVHLLEAARLYLAGAHALATGHLESNLGTLIDEADAGWLKPFVRRHVERLAAATLEPEEVDLLAWELNQLERRLSEALEASPLPEAVGSITMLDEFLIELRLRELQTA